jgi:hypothetical protein
MLPSLRANYRHKQHGDACRYRNEQDLHASAEKILSLIPRKCATL